MTFKAGSDLPEWLRDVDWSAAQKYEPPQGVPGATEVAREQAESLIDPRVGAAFAALKRANKELDEIRKQCAHKTHFLAWWSWRPGRISPSRVCAVCRDDVPGITDEESARLGPLFSEYI